ncbi:glycosyltransferase family 4 protein [Sinomonas albida]|uniref:glycosyltransferase family 4 protein n=1 Tax=Sinomonas albida TaxID=369942 RepID=UPI00301B2C0A
MRVLVYPHDLGIGGSQLNAIQLAAAVRDRGHAVVVYGQPGPLVGEVAAAGLEFIRSPDVHVRPTPGVVRDLARVLAERRIDIAHGYEWPPSLEALLACRVAHTGRAVSTVLSMSVAPFLPRYLPLGVGTEQIREAEREHGRPDVELLEPPVDVAANAPGAVPVAAFAREHGIEPRIFTVSIVSRLAREMKLEGILTAMDAVELLHREAPIQLVIAGGGPAETEVRAHAAAVNGIAGEQIVVCTGELTDPRPVYALADVGIGMGGSALRSMAFGVPLIVQGERGFWRTLSAATVEDFLWQGWYGVGPGSGGAAERLAACLRELRDDRGLREALGRLARETVESRFSVSRVAERQIAFYERAIAAPPRTSWRETLDAGFGLFAYHAHRALASRTGPAPSEDFNSRPVAAERGAAAGARER